MLCRSNLYGPFCYVNADFMRRRAQMVLHQTLIDGVDIHMPGANVPYVLYAGDALILGDAFGDTHPDLTVIW